MLLRLGPLVVSAIILLPACDGEPADAPPEADAGAGADAGVQEPADAGEPTDAGGRNATHIFGIDYQTPAIVRVSLADLSREDVLTFPGPCGMTGCPTYDLDPVSNTIYHSDLTLREVHRLELDTSADQLVWTAPQDIIALQIAPKDDVLYAVLRDDPPIDNDYFTAYRVDLATGDAEMIIERAGAPFGVDLSRNVVWYQRGSALWRTDLASGAHTLAFGGPFHYLSEIDLGPHGTIVTFPGASPEIQRLTREGRAPETLIADATGTSFDRFGLNADPASEKLIWFQLEDITSTTPDMIYAETPSSTPRKLETPFIFEIRFDGIADAEPADPSEHGVPRPNSMIDFTPCADAPELDCGELIVPIDHQNPGGDMATLPVRRKRALRDDRRLGVIFYDYGGPSTSFIEQFNRARFDDGVAGSGVALVDRFDLIALERRGIAPATPSFECAPNAPFVPRMMQEADWTRLIAWWSSVHADCAGHPLIDHLASRDVAADFETLRLALGEEKINLVTWSYGTTVGATYATEYPNAVRAIALISPTRPVQDSIDRIRVRTALEERAFADFFDWCALEDLYCPLAMDTNSALEVKMRFDAILADLDLTPIRIGFSAYGREAVISYLSARNWFASSAWRTHGRVLGAMHAGDREPLTAALRDYFVSGDPVFSSGDWSTMGQPQISIFLGVHGLDRPFPESFDTSAARALTEEMASSYEYLGNSVAVTTCALAEWPVTSPPGLNLGPSSAPPLLVVASRFDYATNYEFGQEMVDALANESLLITFEGHSHSAGGFDACIGDLVTDYLLDPSKPPRTTICEEAPVERWP